MITIKCFNANSPHDSQTVELTPETMISRACFIGRSPNCTIVCTSAEVSRVHGSISLLDGQYHFTDLAIAAASGLTMNRQKLIINIL